MLVVVLAGTVGFLVAVATGAELSFGLVFFGVGVLYWWFSILYQLFYEVTLHEDGEVEFKSVLRTRRVRATDIEAIVPRWGGVDLYTMTVRTTHGKLHMIRGMSNMFDFGTRLRELNPTVDLRRF